MTDVTVGDVRDDPVFGPALDEANRRIEYEGAQTEYRIRLKGGLAIPKALWRRLLRGKREFGASS
jgi:hypothetical protein